MLRRILTGIAVFVIAVALIVTILPLTNERASAAEGNLAEASDAANGGDNTFGCELRRGKRRMMRQAADLDGDGYPDLPADGVTPRRGRDRVREREDEAERPFRGRGCRGGTAAESP